MAMATTAAASTGPGAMDWVKVVELVPGQPYRARSELVNAERRRSEYNTARIKADEGISLAIQRSRDMVCGVCLEVVFDKDNPRERRFGILPNCSHCYCLECIRTWRSVKCLDRKNVKSCPTCRTRSQFFIPSDYWVEDEDDKQKLIQKYKDGMASKPCRYFDEGRGTCHFGSKCFYNHDFWEGARPQTRQPWRRLPWGWDFTEPSSSDTVSQAARHRWQWQQQQQHPRDQGQWTGEEEDMYPLDLTEMLLRLLADSED